MLWRVISFFMLMLAGGLAGGWLASSWYAASAELLAFATGLVLGALVWFVVDVSRAARLLRWLRKGELSQGALNTGVWGEVSDRVRRLVRASEKETSDIQRRLQDFLAAFQASPNGVVLLDAQGRIEWFNLIAALHFGFDAERDMLQHIGNLVRDPGFARHLAIHDYAHELTMPGRQSTPAHPVSLSVHLHSYGQGRLLLLSRDITAVEQAEVMRRDFIANVSHEIRTPLTVLSGFVETLQNCDLDARERERYLALMAQQSDRMQTLVSDLLTLSRLEGNPLPATSDWIPMATLMRQLEQEALALNVALAGTLERQHKLVFDCAMKAEVAGSGSELFSAMSNLVGNALRHTPPGGEILVRSVLLPNGRAVFSVSDTGPGIAVEHIARLTERFYRVDASRSRDTGGTGLGLAIVKHVVLRHSAELTMESTPGKGSVFSITFPASRVRNPPNTA